MTPEQSSGGDSANSDSYVFAQCSGLTKLIDERYTCHKERHNEWLTAQSLKRPCRAAALVQCRRILMIEYQT